MLNKTLLAILIFCTSITSYAYQIESKFNVENKTAVPLKLIITEPGNQYPTISMPIKPGQTRTFTVDNNQWGTGWLNQTISAPFTIVDNDELKTYAEGRLNFYVYSGFLSLSSFLDAVSAAEGITVNPLYSCQDSSQWNGFENSIVITGVPGKELGASKLSTTPVTCKGVRYASTSADYKTYIPVCFDGKSTTFTFRYETYGSYCIDKHSCSEPGFKPTYSDDKGSYTLFPLKNTSIRLGTIDKAEIGDLEYSLSRIGNAFCNDWAAWWDLEYRYPNNGHHSGA